MPSEISRLLTLDAHDCRPPPSPPLPPRSIWLCPRRKGFEGGMEGYEDVHGPSFLLFDPFPLREMERFRNL